MPLTKSSSQQAFKANVAAEIRAGRPRDQALAIAYRVQRDAKRKAHGGRVQTEDEIMSEMARRAAADRTRNSTIRRFADGGMASPPFHARSSARTLERSGFIKSPVAGRTDKVPMGVGANSYVMPADVVSGIGQGNSLAGANALNKLFKLGPYGSQTPKMKPSSRGMMRGRKGFAEGGEVGEPSGEPVDIVAAGGEFVVPPETVAELGGGDVEAGHALLDAMVKQIRAKAIKTLRNLPGPKKR
jgi:hypothetical protein